MDAASSGATSQDIRPKCANDTAAAKRLPDGDGAALPEPKRAKTDENPDSGPDKGPYVSDLSGTTHKSQKGKQNGKNKGRRRGTRPQVDDHADRPKTPRLPKKQCAILIGFLGTNYAGMQM
jgi:tRNA pseudouridine38-40 synthase